MKRRYAAMVLGLTLAFASVSAFAAESAEAPETEIVAALEEGAPEDAQDQVMGEVQSVGEDSITIAVGTMPQPGEDNPGEAKEVIDEEAATEADDDTDSEDAGSADGDAANSEGQESNVGEDADKPMDSEEPMDGFPGQSVTLELTGEEQTVTITEDTVITRQSVNTGENQPGQAGGEVFEGEGTNEAPDSEEKDAEGQMDTSEPEGTAGGDGAADASEPEDAAVEGSGENALVPGGAAGEESMENAKRPEAGDPVQGIEAEEITLEDIQEGDIVRITFDEDGNVASITVMQSNDDLQGGAAGGDTAGEAEVAASENAASEEEDTEA